MPNIHNNYVPIPQNEKESPSWIAIAVVLFLQLYPIAAIMTFFKLRTKWKNHKLENYRRYLRTIGDRESVSIKKLSKTLGAPKSDVRSVLSKMIANGYLGQEAYIDYSDDRLYITKAAVGTQSDDESGFSFDINVSSGLSDIITGIAGIAADVASTLKSEFKVQQNAPTGHRYAPSGSTVNTEAYAEPAKPEPQKEEPVKAEAVVTDMSESEATLARLKQLNDDILDEEVSRKIDRIAMLTGDIYAFVSLNPERAGEVRKFMNYYLPTTMKLLTSYSMLEHQSYQGANIVNARRDIEKILDTLVHAFEKQLDQLFATDAVDISSDIQVLETMMAKDGLSEKTKGYKLQI